MGTHRLRITKHAVVSPRHGFGQSHRSAHVGSRRLFGPDEQVLLDSCGARCPQSEKWSHALWATGSRSGMSRSGRDKGDRYIGDRTSRVTEMQTGRARSRVANGAASGVNGCVARRITTDCCPGPLNSRTITASLSGPMRTSRGATFNLMGTCLLDFARGRCELELGPSSCAACRRSTPESAR